MTPQTINSKLHGENRNLPIGVLMSRIGATTKHWAGGMKISIQVPGGDVRRFHYDFQTEIWLEQFEFDSPREIPASVVRDIFERILYKLQ